VENDIFFILTAFC